MNEWIDWPGGECPVAKDVRVSVRLRSGSEYLKPEVAIGYDWSHDNTGGDIIAYRVAAPLETGTTSVWEVYNKTSSALFESEELAQKYIGQFGASVGGGMSIAERPIHRVHPPASPAATPRTDAEMYFDHEDNREIVAADFARTLERECAELLGQHRAANAAIALQDRTIAELRGKLEEAQERAANVEEAKRLTFGLLAKQLSTARQDALEEAAKVADGYNYGPCGQYDYGYTDAQEKADERAGQIADDIRALKEEA